MSLQVAVVSSSRTDAKKLPPKRLAYECESEEEEEEEQQQEVNTYKYQYVSPLEKEIQKAEQAVADQQMIHDEKTAEFMQYMENFPTPSGDSSKSLCGKCHFRVGHKKQNCKSKEDCVSAEVCGQLKFHPVEKQRLAKKAKARADAEAKLKELNETMKSTIDRL